MYAFVNASSYGNDWQRQSSTSRQSVQINKKSGQPFLKAAFLHELHTADQYPYSYVEKNAAIVDQLDEFQTRGTYTFGWIFTKDGEPITWRLTLPRKKRRICADDRTLRLQPGFLS